MHQTFTHSIEFYQAAYKKDRKFIEKGRHEIL